MGPGLRGHFVLYHWTDTLGLSGPCVDREHASVNTENSSRKAKIGRKEGGRLCRSSAAHAGHGVGPGLRGYFVVCLLHQQHPFVNTENSSRGSQNRKKIRGDRDASALLQGLDMTCPLLPRRHFMVGHNVLVHCDCCVICCGLYYSSLSGWTRDGEIGRKGGGPSCNTAHRGICKTPPPRLILHTAGTDWATQNRKKGGGARLADACFCKGCMS